MQDVYNTGTIVVDKEQENPSEAVVIRKTDRRISQWTVDDEGTTVHDDNPEYDDGELTTLVVYTDYLDEEWPQWKETDPENLYNQVIGRSHIGWYAFPESRLIPKKRYMPGEYATLSDEGKEKYGHIFEVDRLPLRHIISQSSKSEDPQTEEEKETQTFAIDYEKLLPEEREKLSEFLKDKFNETDEEFEERLSEMSYTVPIRTKFLERAKSQQPFKYL